MGKTKNEVVIIQLDRPRELRFGHKALKTLIALTGKDLDALGFENGIDLEEIEKCVYCGLLSDAREHGETLTLEGMEDLLDLAPSIGDVIAKVMEAMNKAWGSLAGDSQAGNQPEPAK